jgi:hypothetical protein
MMISVVLAHVRQGHRLVGSLKRERAIGTGAIGVIEPEALDRRATDLQFGNVANLDRTRRQICKVVEVVRRAVERSERDW